MAKQSDAESPIVVGCTEEIRQIFDKFDKNGDGKISCSEVVESLKELGTAVTSAEDCKKMIRQVDQDGDGSVNFEEFKKMMASGNRAPAA
ncbi:Probable calcium-binding protein CML26 [Linum perenne]